MLCWLRRVTVAALLLTFRHVVAFYRLDDSRVVSVLALQIHLGFDNGLSRIDVPHSKSSLSFYSRSLLGSR